MDVSMCVWCPCEGECVCVCACVKLCVHVCVSHSVFFCVSEPRSWTVRR
jgi:hypothetical protein